MTWTYSGNPGDSDKDAVRFLVGDTDVNNQKAQDEEINYILSLTSNLHLAAAQVCEAIAAKYSCACSEKVGDLSRDCTKIAGQFRARAQELRTLAVLDISADEIFAGGLIKAGKETLNTDTSATQPLFKIGRDDYPGAADDYFEYHYDGWYP